MRNNNETNHNIDHGGDDNGMNVNVGNNFREQMRTPTQSTLESNVHTIAAGITTTNVHVAAAHRGTKDDHCREQEDEIYLEANQSSQEDSEGKETTNHKNRKGKDRSEHPDQDPEDDDEDDDDDEEEEEPDWEAISQHEPASTDVPIFLSARDRRDAAFARFGAALDECHASLKHSVDELLSTAAQIHHVQSEKLDELEMEIKQHFVQNEVKRDAMHQKLQESATAAQGLFSQLLLRVSQPLQTACGQLNLNSLLLAPPQAPSSVTTTTTTSSLPLPASTTPMTAAPKTMGQPKQTSGRKRTVASTGKTSIVRKRNRNVNSSTTIE